MDGHLSSTSRLSFSSFSDEDPNQKEKQTTMTKPYPDFEDNENHEVRPMQATNEVMAFPGGAFDRQRLGCEILLLSLGDACEGEKKKRQNGALHHCAKQGGHQWDIPIGAGLSGWISAAIKPLSPSP